MFCSFCYFDLSVQLTLQKLSRTTLVAPSLRNAIANAQSNISRQSYVANVLEETLAIGLATTWTALFVQRQNITTCLWTWSALSQTIKSCSASYWSFDCLFEMSAQSQTIWPLRVNQENNQNEFVTVVLRSHFRAIACQTKCIIVWNVLEGALAVCFVTTLTVFQHVMFLGPEAP